MGIAAVTRKVRNLKSARKSDLEAFIREHERDDPGDMDKLDAALKRPASQKSSATREASKPDDGGDCT